MSRDPVGPLNKLAGAHRRRERIAAQATIGYMAVTVLFGIAVGVLTPTVHTPTTNAIMCAAAVAVALGGDLAVYLITTRRLKKLMRETVESAIWTHVKETR